MIPQFSSFCLIQESLWPDRWAILVSCMMLNCTKRKQVEAVLPVFLKLWPTSAKFMSATHEEIVEVVRSLGFGNRRAAALMKMTRAYLCSNWASVSELPGVGAYATRAYEIFCEGQLGNTVPRDGALGRYYTWRMKNGEQQIGIIDQGKEAKEGVQRSSDVEGQEEH